MLNNNVLWLSMFSESYGAHIYVTRVVVKDIGYRPYIDFIKEKRHMDVREA